MSSLVAYYTAASAVIIALSIIFQVNGQPTVEVSEKGDSSNIVVEAIQQLRVELHVLGQLKEAVLSMKELINASSQQNLIRTQRDIHVDNRRSQEQVQSIHEVLNGFFLQMTTILQAVHIKQIQSVHELVNASFQEVKSQQDAVVTSIQAIDRRSQEQNIYITQIQSIHRLINETNLRGNDISIRNKTQFFWKRETAFATEVGEVPIFLSLAYDWIVLMNRFDGSLNFNRSWTEYKNGFGDIGRGEFWLGNEKIHRLTNTHGVAYTLRIQIQLNATGQWYYADYDTFSIDSESNKYTLHLSGYSGNAGDSLTNTSLRSSFFLDGMYFSTFDNDNDRGVDLNCAMSFGGGWWFNYCYHACLTCSYNVTYGFMWYSLGHLSSDGSGKLRAARMMIKSK